MKNIFFSAFIIFLLLSGCAKDEFDVKAIRDDFGDTTYVINPVSGNNDYTFCFYPYNSVTLDASTSDTSATYLWEPGGETTSSIQADEYMNYTLNYFSATDTAEIAIYIESCMPTMFIPNSFSPDYDGINDFWTPVYSNVTAIHVEVRDYDGVKIFSADDLNNTRWDGTYQGMLMPQGFYLYYINFSSVAAENYTKTGSLELIR